jgi:hypothetical protein
MTRNGNNVDDDPTTTTKMKMEAPATRGDSNGVDSRTNWQRTSARPVTIIPAGANIELAVVVNQRHGLVLGRIAEPQGGA